MEMCALLAETVTGDFLVPEEGQSRLRQAGKMPVRHQTGIKKEDRSAKDWLDDLNPEQKRMLGEMLKEFL